MATEVISTIRQTTTNSGLTRASNVVTVTLSVGTQLNPQAGDTVIVSGVTPSSFNGTHTIASRISSTQYTYVQTGSGESSTVHGSSGGDYTSLSSWEAGEQGNLVSLDKIHTAECYNDWPSGMSGTVTIDGSTTDSTRYMKITVASGHRHGGIPGAGFYITIATGTTAPITVADDYTLVEYVDARHTRTDLGTPAVTVNVPGCTFKYCLAKTTSGGAAFINVSSSGTQTYIGCLAYGSTTGFGVYSSTRTSNLYNCVAAGCTTGFDSQGGSSVAKNCVAYNNTTNFSATWGASSTNNATSSASDDAPGASSVTSVASGDFVNAASNDFHLSSGSVLRGAGTNLYSTFTTDIDGDTWPSSGAWDIGFDYYASAAAASAVPRKAFPRAILNF